MLRKLLTNANWIPRNNSWNNILLITRRSNHFTADFLSKNAANYVPLSPLSCFKKTLLLHPTLSCYVSGDISRNWSEVGERVSQLASAFDSYGINKGKVRLTIL